MTITFQQFIDKAQQVVDAKQNLVTALGDQTGKSLAEKAATAARVAADQVVSDDRGNLAGKILDLQSAAADLGSLGDQGGDLQVGATGGAGPMTGPGVGPVLAQSSSQGGDPPGVLSPPRHSNFRGVVGQSNRWHVVSRIQGWLQSAGVPPGTVAHVMILVATDASQGKSYTMIRDEVAAYLKSIGFDV